MGELQKEVASPPLESPEENAAGEKRRAFWRRPVIALGTLVLAGVLLGGLPYIVESWTHESTDDAFLDANIVSLAPRVAGQVLRMLVEDNQVVTNGELLLEIDPRDLQVQLDQKKAAVRTAAANFELLKASLELSRAQVTSAESTAKQTAAEAAAAQATAQRAAADLKRAEELSANRTISAQEFDTARSIATAAEASYNAAREKAASDQSKVSEALAQVAASQKALDRAAAQTMQAEWEEKAAELNLSYTRVTAPTAGRVTRKAVEDGDYVQPGQRLMALVPHELFVTANFKETQLRNIRTNQLVRIHVDALGGAPFTGHVDSIQAGSGARFSLLPPENAVGNYVKVVQRVPVKIVFERPLETSQTLGPGMSVVPSVRVTSYEVPEMETRVTAIVLALVVGGIWLFVAERQARA
jgi:membrane fusion protein (multidrug efflux system)